MPKYLKDGQVIEVAQPELNPELIKGLSQVSESTPLGIISSDILSPVASVTPTYPKPITTSSIPTPAPLRTQEQKSQDINQRIQELSNTLLGKAATTRQLTSSLLAPLQITQRDLTSQIESYRLRAQDIQNQIANIPAQIQSEFAGRGATAAGTAPIQAGRIRELQGQAAINASNALVVTAHLNATNGLIQTAQNQIEQAIDLKYGDTEEQLRILQANAKIIQDSPAYDAETKARAADIQAQSQARVNALSLAKEEEKAAQNLVVKIASLNPNIDQETLALMKNAKDQTGVLQIAKNKRLETGASTKTNWKVTTISAGTDEYGNKLTQKVWYNDRTFEIKPFIEGGVSPDRETTTPTISSTTNQPTTIISEKQHSDLSSQLKPGEILVKDQQGNIGAILSNEFDSNKYTHIDSEISPSGTDPLALASLPPAQRKIAEMMSQYKYPLPSSFALRSPFWIKIITAMANYDPSFDITQYNARLKLRTSFTSGADSQNITSINTAIGHLNSLSKSIKDLSVFRFLPYSSRYKNTVSRFETDKTALASELTRVFRGTGGAESDVWDWKERFDKNSTKGTLNTALDEAVDLLSSRLYNMSQKWETGMGKPKDFKILNEKSREILRNLGKDVESIDPINQ